MQICQYAQGHPSSCIENREGPHSTLPVLKVPNGCSPPAPNATMQAANHVVKRRQDSSMPVPAAHSFMGRELCG